MLQKKRMVAVLPSDPKHCPKCGEPLEECDALYMIWEPAMTALNVDSPRRHYYCMTCDCERQPKDIPDHPLYEPQEYDPTECPHCHEHARRETDIDLHGDYHIHTYICAHCEKLWTERHENH